MTMSLVSPGAICTWRWQSHQHEVLASHCVPTSMLYLCKVVLVRILPKRCLDCFWLRDEEVLALAVLQGRLPICE
jgi:hypothetical protein